MSVLVRNKDEKAQDSEANPIKFNWAQTILLI